MLVTIGFGVVSQFVVKVGRGAKRSIKELSKLIRDEFKITVMLMEVNGKELLKPIAKEKTYTLSDNTESVKVKTIRVQKKQKRIFNVIANLMKVKRDSDGED